MSTEAKQHIDSIINDRNLLYVYQSLENGVIALNDYRDRNPLIFSSCYSSNISGRMLSHFINMQFEESFLSKKFPFNVRCRQEHSSKVPELSINNIILTPKRCNDISEILDGQTQYMKSLSRGNRVLDGQLSVFDFFPTDKTNKIYGVLAYSNFDSVNKQFDFVKIIFPHESLRSYFYIKDVKPKIRIYSSIEDISHDEQRLMTVEKLTKNVQRTYINKEEVVIGDDK